jgi:hypothetical protein
MLQLKLLRQSSVNWINRLFKVGLLSLLLGSVACGALQTQEPASPVASDPPLASVQASPEGATLTPSAAPSASPSATMPATPTAELVANLKARVSQEFGIAETQLQVQESQAIDWPDSCLGAAQPEELCAQMITSGYRIVLTSGVQQFEFHTDRNGRAVRQVR